MSSIFRLRDLRPLLPLQSVYNVYAGVGTTIWITIKRLEIGRKGVVSPRRLSCDSIYKPEDSFGFTCGVLLIRSTKFVAYIMSTTLHHRCEQYRCISKTLLMATWKLALRTGWRAVTRIMIQHTHTHTGYNMQVLYNMILHYIIYV